MYHAEIPPRGGPRSRTGSIAPQGFRRTVGSTDAIQNGQIYVRSTTGYDGNSGGSWATAKATGAGAIAVSSATLNNTIYFSQAHAETQASSLTWTILGTVASKFIHKFLCVSDVGSPQPPTAVTTGATISTTSTGTIRIVGSGYFYGLQFRAGSAANSASIRLDPFETNNGRQVYDNVTFYLLGSGSTSLIEVGYTGGKIATSIVWNNCIARTASTSQSIGMGGSSFIWSGGSWAAGTTPSTMINAYSGGTSAWNHFVIEGVDLSNMASNFNVFNGTFLSAARPVLRNIKLPASWSGVLAVNKAGPDQRISMYNTDNTGTNYRLYVDDYIGDIKHETTIVRTSGASDGTTPLSWKMATNTLAVYPLVPLVSPEIVIWNDTTGSSKTVTIEFVHDSLTALNNNEIWVELLELATSGFPLGTIDSNKLGNVLAVATAQPSSGVAWTTTGMTNPNKQSLSVTFTPQLKGYIHAKVYLAAPSKTVYIDPLITVT